MKETAVRAAHHLEEILGKAKRHDLLSGEETRFLLELRDSHAIDAIFQTARELRRTYFDDRIFFYGFIYFSTWCRNDCSFCLYRRSNPKARRYRKTKQEILQIGYRLAESGVHLLDLTMGEDPYFHEGLNGYSELVGLVLALKQGTKLPLMVSPGVVPLETLKALREVGADWFACYQESHNRSLFGRLRLGQDFDERIESKRRALGLGLLVEEGILVGVGEELEDIVFSANAMRELGAHQIRAMTLVPQRCTPFEKWPLPSSRRELITLAVLRLLFPDRLIPASLDIRGVKGLKDRLAAGANVVTSVIPPGVELAGVSQSSMDIETGSRSIKAVLPILHGMGLEMATQKEYRAWIDHEKRALLQGAYSE